MWGMESNKFEKDSVHDCSQDCYDDWEQETGGVVALAAAKAEAKAAASPVELGKATYTGCIACHGSGMSWMAMDRNGRRWAAIDSNLPCRRRRRPPSKHT